jgi:hypothetical protein
MGAPTSDLQYLFEFQLQQTNGKKINLQLQNYDILFQNVLKRKL